MKHIEPILVMETECEFQSLFSTNSPEIYSLDFERENGLMLHVINQ